MKLKIGYVETIIDFEQHPIWYLQIESRQLFNNIVQSIAASIADEVGSERIILSNNEKEIKSSLYIELITDYFCFDIQSKSLQTKLINYINNAIDEEDKLIINNKLEEIGILYNTNMIDFDMDVGFNKEITFINFTKFLAPQLFFSYKDSLYCRLEKWIKIVAELQLAKIIVLVNPYEILETKEVYEIIKLVQYQDLSLIILMNYLLDEKFDDEVIIQIDEEYEEYVR